MTIEFSESVGSTGWRNYEFAHSLKKLLGRFDGRMRRFIWHAEAVSRGADALVPGLVKVDGLGGGDGW